MSFGILRKISLQHPLCIACIICNSFAFVLAEVVEVLAIFQQGLHVIVYHTIFPAVICKTLYLIVEVVVMLQLAQQHPEGGIGIGMGGVGIKGRFTTFAPALCPVAAFCFCLNNNGNPGGFQYMPQVPEIYPTPSPWLFLGNNGILHIYNTCQLMPGRYYVHGQMQGHMPTPPLSPSSCSK
jgi:hypothetical protein